MSAVNLIDPTNSNAAIGVPTNPLPIKIGAGYLPQSSYRVAVTPTVTAATYGANKVVGGIMTFANILPVTTFAGIIESLTLKFKGSVQTIPMYFALFDTSPSGTFTDTNTAAIAAGDSALLLGLYTLQTPSSVLGTHTIYNLDGIAKAIQGASTSLYGVVVASGTMATLGSTSDMTASIGVIQG